MASFILLIAANRCNNAISRLAAIDDFVPMQIELNVDGNDYELIINKIFQSLTDFEIFTFADYLNKSIESRDFNFLKTLKPYENQDLSSKGCFLDKDFFTVFDIFNISDKNYFDISLFPTDNKGLHLVFFASGFIESGKVNFRVFKNPHLSSVIENGFANQKIVNVFEKVIFKKYAPIEQKTVKGIKSIKRQRKPKASSFINVELIDSKWFTTLIKSDSFGVKGHFALRACGKGRSERKLVWINPYEKSGYTRTAKMLST